ncbi:MAG: helix-turn-helix domain-containing protein, partial [Thermodesulfobacteriota bacterium]|nr:helix-turn-helix domain-containing protein [Thermodesulfobacteriota bacterium]
AVSEGKFREDLYYRLQVVTITMPPLREHPEDLNLLCQYLLNRLSCEMNMNNPGISNKTIELMKSYNWPGNIRQLYNVLKKALIFNRGASLKPELPDQNLSPSPDPAEEAPASNTIQQWIQICLTSDKTENIFDSCLDHVASLLIKEALDLSQGNRSRAAKLLGISRPTFHSKIEKYGITIGSSK